MSLDFAHETWFGHGVYPTDWSFAAENLTLAALAAAVLTTVVVRLEFARANELMGHLPIYGAMLALLVYGSNPQLRPAVSALLPPGLSLRRRAPTAPAEAVA